MYVKRAIFILETYESQCKINNNNKKKKKKKKRRNVWYVRLTKLKSACASHPVLSEYVLSVWRPYSSLTVQIQPVKILISLYERAHRLFWSFSERTYPRFLTFWLICFIGISQGPVVQSIVSLTSSLVGKLLTVLASAISNSLVFLLKNVSSFCKCKSYSHLFQQKY